MNMRRLLRRILAPTAVTALASASLLTATAAPAAADSAVTGYSYDTYVTAYTGGKNFSNHTQWVGYVDVGSSGGNDQIQAWTYNYYQQSGSGSSHRFWVGQWVPTGNNVCGATVRGGTRHIACISIRV